MFNTIEPKIHRKNQIEIASFLGLLNIYQNYSPAEKERYKATFIISSDNDYGVYGGALLLKKSVSNLNEKIRKIILTFQPELKTVWIAKIGLYKEHDKHSTTSKIYGDYLDFYQELLKAFSSFGKEKGAHFLCLTLNSIEHLKLKKHGFWDYVGTVLPNESLDGLFHSILSLSGRGK